MPDSLPKRARGQYSKLICISCRARKIKCVLPDDITPELSGQPQSVDKACQRCQERDLECVVDRTSLGRPAHKRRRPDSVLLEDARTTASSSLTVTAAESEPSSPDEESFFLSHGQEFRRLYESHQTPRPQKPRPSVAELFDTLASPIYLLSTFLSRDKHFTTSVPAAEALQEKTPILILITDETARRLDEQLVWHKLYFPYIPSLLQLKQQITPPEDPSNLPSTFLFAVLCSIAMAGPVNRLSTQRSLQPALQKIVFHHGQTVLFSLPRHRHTIIALELVAEYLPLSLVTSSHAVAFAARGQLYITCAKQVAIQSDLCSAVDRLRNALEHPDGSDASQLVLDCLQWGSLVAAEMELDGYSRLQQNDSWQQCPSLESMLEVLKRSLDGRRMPPEAYFLFHRLAIFADETASLRNASKNWRSRERLGEVVLHSETRSKQLRADVDVTRHTLITGAAQADTSSSAITQVTDALIHARHVSVVGICLFYAVMSTNISVPPARTTSTTHAPPPPLDAANLPPSSAGQISTHIATSLRSHSASEPSRPLIRTFLETFGRDRMDTLETQLTAFISLCDDTRLHGIPFAPPLRRTAAGMLSSCKDVVESNAARLKGWGGAHGRIGVQIVLLGEVARRLEGMDGVMAGGEPEGEGEGVGMGMGRAAARLVRGLQRILKGWERREREKERGIGHADGEGLTAESNTAGPAERSGTGLEAAQPGDDSRCPGDLFVDWDSWPQIDGYDWSELFSEGAGI